MKRNDQKSPNCHLHLYIDHINDELKSYLPYILALVHSSMAVLPPSLTTPMTQSAPALGNMAIHAPNWMAPTVLG
jgi:hypothetical protein